MDFPGHFQLIFKQLNQQRLHAQLCDCVVMVGGQTFRAHGSILAACSSHFRALLGSSDEGPGAHRDGAPIVMELDPEVVTPEAFSTLLDMIYTSTLSLGVSNVMDVLLAASHLHLNTVVKACKLHLSRKNFPTSAPKGWRSVKQQVTVEDSDNEDVVVEVSQSGGQEGGNRKTAQSLRQKRKSNEERLDDKKRISRLPEGAYKEHSPTVTRSTEEGGDPSSLDCMKMAVSWENQDHEEEEKKYKATKGEMEEIQLPTQSDSSPGGAEVWKKGEDGDAVVKVKVGEEEQDESTMAAIEIKKETLCSFTSDLDALPNGSPPPLLQDCAGSLEAQVSDEKKATAETHRASVCTAALREAGDLGEDAVDGEGLDSLSELTFSCFLNPCSESVMGALGEEDSLVSLTAAATASDAPTDVSLRSDKSEEPGTSSTQCSDSSSSLVFPVTSVPLQQLLPTQSSGFSDTIILQSTQNPLTGFFRPGLDASLVQPSRPTKSSGATAFRRIAPKISPGSEAGTDTSSAAEPTDRPTLTRASEDVLSKCKKAAAEDHVLLVEGEKKYACKICCKTFMNLTDCKKHIRVHTGEKPYPCPKCGKRFSQSSHLYKHSKNSCMSWREDQPFPNALL
ncbi:zinc finger and BTB domain-containing protein 5 [Nematolebias whitei]|uniref:zinc finger and BTB domain-containing protein 5 n=1 Tax=Nematolebias whitei TaxID=451745 RepID=UPI001898918D|nr:zinc finger and BTB domain-containing protein 5 [Nematolebias whitei]